MNNWQQCCNFLIFHQNVYIKKLAKRNGSNSNDCNPQASQQHPKWSADHGVGVVRVQLQVTNSKTCCYLKIKVLATSFSLVTCKYSGMTLLRGKILATFVAALPSSALAGCYKLLALAKAAVPSTERASSSSNLPVTVWGSVCPLLLLYLYPFLCPHLHPAFKM